MDPELRDQLNEINRNLGEINKKSKSRGLLKAFFTGMFSALGYIAGLALVVVILGWVLQKTGLLQPFEEQVRNFTDLINSARNLIPEKNSTSTPSKPGSQKQNSGETIVTLPDGQQVKLNLSSGN